MNKEQTSKGQARWEADFAKSVVGATTIYNRSGVGIRPLYTPQDTKGTQYEETLGYPGQYPYTRGIYATMYRGRSWSQRQLIGLGVPEDYNLRVKEILELGASALSLIPCNSVFRGYDADEVPSELLGTCGTVINHVEDMGVALDGVPIGDLSTAMNDPSPFTLLAFELGVAKRRGVPWSKITGTSNQSDCISHFVANHMFFRLALQGARRVIVDHIAFVNKHVPGWNPLSIVGQHMQQAGATPAEAMAFTLCSGIQYAEDCIAAGMDPDQFLPRFTFFFDISISFFEEVAKFRAGRRVWARLCRDRFGAKDPRSWRFKFHGQTSGVDLTRQQPLNNVARVTAQAMAGIFGGLQSLHTDGYDEAFSTPTAEAARIAVATQNILREEAHLTDVIDPLGGSYYVESLTDDIEMKINEIISMIDEAGGMYQAVEKGIVQRMIGESALAFQRKVDAGEQTIVGVNAYQVEEDPVTYPSLEYPDAERMKSYLRRLADFKKSRSKDDVEKAISALAKSANNIKSNVFEHVVAAAEVGATHGEICGTLRREMGFGQPLTVV
ncbi:MULTISPECIES: acyl-CoA mutase large subunit family protein [unclassified Polaromonas]|jgi:methylmalonyl-CoA mutase N-terminal domain/subunit|uniref:acyl-CoA mutase large subunit family protein n=1 Tax=unclassified Polaromonas TaxID=2638319 RepID=UPI000BC70F8B|nr:MULTISPECIES: acyl-CoA mutase large subunit family protein [unclassified Polaromonas]OYY32807.1 MAG: methylmalonyl-CoA mutase [Polaromonas sp. 35-63-35]OYZ16036.1 MAG: methylmalonyl-CoA mutase [Polaromonas sp. 16-63-31]OYZ76216.1 MAG: methylmalonyl-CoA mutase [Polaromonas sp. 24-63-21]OZA47435.1 MAG: methylmalonyl-CoA mutase [Polaromonas sp. 17-63-33]OZA85538.1 MAG: methylmalonyl-CoA mutase [Polaromonas sp. 39-63-25]